ncbi:MAG: hypothetical protein M1548_05660 [Actinobacteria bacterium]|nr:hypothetical protein [Actinomycetota bacterium]
MGERSASEMAELEVKEVTVTSHLDQLDQRIKMAVKMASNCHLAYEKASPQTKRLLNQAFFEKIYLKNRGISGYDLHTAIRSTFVMSWF